jgi:hypothetical protein
VSPKINFSLTRAALITCAAQKQFPIIWQISAQRGCVGHRIQRLLDSPAYLDRQLSRATKGRATNSFAPDFALHSNYC